MKVHRSTTGAGPEVPRPRLPAPGSRSCRGFAPSGGVGALLLFLLPPLLLLALAPTPASAQIGLFDALARQFSDISFFVNSGGVLPASDEISSTRMVNYGIEVLLEIGEITRPTGPAPPPGDSVVLVWTGMQVIRSEAGVDTVNTYEVRPIVRRTPTETIWTFELGVGYGQLTGFALRATDLDMRGAVRDLPALSLYASYAPLGGYFGLRSGFMKFQGLQVFGDEGQVWSGEAESFLAGVNAGMFFDLLGMTLFVEGAYTWRDFPSIRWSGPASLPPNMPRDIGLSGWSVGTGLQFSIGRS